MANLRLVSIVAIDSVTVQASFTHELEPLINTSNITVVSNVPGVPDAEVRAVEISGKEIKVTTLPLTPNAIYIVTFKSSDIQNFVSKDGQNFILDDSITNSPLILGPEEPQDEFRKILLDYQKDGPYNLIPYGLVRTIINSQSVNLSRALHDIGQAKNDNYLQNIIFDERKTRGEGPFDRLNEEGAFEIVRVGLKETGATASGSISFTSFPKSPVTLQSVSIGAETLVAGTTASTFNGLTLTVANSPAIKLISLNITYAVGGSDTYDISTFGYQIKNPRFDQDFASTLLSLGDDQFKLNSEAIDNGFVAPVAGDTVVISYEYKSLGRIVDKDTVTVTQVLDAVRKSTPPITAEFSLDFAPVVTVVDSIPTSGGIAFLDPQANPPFSATHPAFLTEIPFRYEGLPNNIGEYSVDYNVGRVFCYGEATNNGTGGFPPVVTYKYRKSFVSRLDYTYDPDTYELVASPLRDLGTETAKISFDYEQTLVDGYDFAGQVHIEALEERVENRLISTSSIRVKNSPVTNAFRVFNETSGEIYPISRFNDNTIFFNPTTPPRIFDRERERAEFKDILNEILLLGSEFANTLTTRVMKVTLSNNNIMSASEDALGISYNSSAAFSRTDIFEQEVYYDTQVLTQTQNTDRLILGQYQVDYDNGIVYVGVSALQGADLGTVNYKSSTIVPQNPHIVSVNELFHSISNLAGVSKRVKYDSFTEGEIVPLTLDLADERFTNGDPTLSYLVISDTITVTDNVKNVRNIYDIYDLNNNVDITNFADDVTILANVITLDSTGVLKKEIQTIASGSVVTVSFISAGAELSDVISVRRVSDDIELYDVGGSFTGYDITLSGVGSPVLGQAVEVVYRVKLTGAATPIVDYNRGDYFIDYTYIADEVIISYEYGDNVLDFRNSTTLDKDDEYYVTYKVGALRDALLKNFGSLVDIPVINSFDTSLNRERYRDALKGALQSFTKGPTIPAMKLLVSSITKIDPEIVESVFKVWSLGISHLSPNEIEDTGDIQLLSGKFDNGAWVVNSDETISFPISSNLRVEEGSLEMWVIPDWNGIDNDATLEFEVLKDGAVLPASKIFIGATGFNPTLDVNNKFKVNRTDIPSPIGLPSKIFTDTGFFIHYDVDDKKWKVHVRESVSIPDEVYSGTIQSSGEVYDVGFIPGLGELNDILRSGVNKIVFEFNIDGYDVLSPDGYVDVYNIIDGYTPGDGYVPGFSFDGIQFMADDLHYLFDWGKTNTTNRFSIFKDGSGYLNFVVFDKNGSRFPVSTDISDWTAGQKYHVGATWRLNTSDRQDEMHLFVNGAEMPNIMRYGGTPIGVSTDRFMTVKPEIVAGVVPKNVITGNDLITTQGSAIVESTSIDFVAGGILIGDTINILESGFTVYTISFVAGNFLTLSAPMPATLSDASFSVNEYSVIVDTQIDLFANIAVSIINGSGDETEIPGLRAVIPAYSISKNGSNQNVLTLLGNADAGDTIAIRTLGLNHRKCKDRQFIWGNVTNILKTQLPPPINLDEVIITSIVMPKIAIGPNNSTLTLGRFIATGLFATQPSNSTEGRLLSITVSGNNVLFVATVEVTINGTTAAGPLFETLIFTSAGTQNTTNKFLTITSVDIETTPLDSSKNSVSVEIKERNSITEAEGNSLFPIVRFSFKAQSGTALVGTGTATLTDADGLFLESFVGQPLVITSPAPVAGTYTIVDKTDTNTIDVTPVPIAFTGGVYDIYNTSIGRSGFQNGFFTFEISGGINVAYTLPEGLYEFEYAAYLEVPFEPVSNINAFVGSDKDGGKQAKSIIDELRILSRKITDIRVGETAGTSVKSFTTDFTALNQFEADSDTLMIMHFDNKPFINSAEFWVTSDRTFMQSDDSINDEFEKSMVLLNKNLQYDNKSILTRSTGSIEFWVSPRYDTYNDPQFRFYFDASAAIKEDVVSIHRGAVKVAGSIGEVLSVRLQTDADNSGREFFAGGTIDDDRLTIRLGKRLPSNTTPVKISYIPAGLSGDRISIFKDNTGFINFTVRANGIDYSVRRPIFWQRDSWHRVMATYKVNSVGNNDEIRLFVDGEEKGQILFGQGLIFGSGIIFGQIFAGDDAGGITSDINFNDPINQLFIGSDFTGVNLAQARFDNIRFSNITREPVNVAGESKDVNYSSNLSVVLPVAEDLFTTLLLDFNKIAFKTDDLAILRDEAFGLFNFDINVIDSFDIVLSNAKIQQILESLILALKPASSKVNITIVQ